MTKELPLSSIRNILNEKTKDELYDMLCRLYEENVAVRTVLNLELQGDKYGEELLEKYIKRLYAVFFPVDMALSGFSANEACAIMNEFLMLVSAPVLRAELMMYFVECGIEFSETFGDHDVALHSIVEDTLQSIMEMSMSYNEVFDQEEGRILDAIDDLSETGSGIHDSFKKTLERFMDTKYPE